MKAFLCPIALVLLVSTGLFAQWPDYKMSGVPRDASGKPVLDAPAPKAADGHPDLSGIWSFRGPARQAPIPGFPQGAGNAPPPAPPPGPPPDESGTPLATFFN